MTEEKFSKYFDLEEFLVSSKAKQKSLQNIPSWEIVLRLRQLAEFLDGLREEWGSGIRITSGYREEKLNEYVGGVGNSIHLIGWAADIQPVNGKMADFKKCVKNWIKDKGFDQCIIEKKGATEWIHIGLYNNGGGQRHNIFSLAV